MESLFPIMHSRPKTGSLFAVGVLWGWVFVLFPMWMPFVGLGIWEKEQYISWFQIGYHIVNGVLVFVPLGKYLKDEWFMVTTDFRYYIGTAAAAFGSMAAVVVVLFRVISAVGIPIENMLNGLPVTEMIIALTPGYLAKVNPIAGTLTMAVFSSLSISGYMYALGFAPVCCKRSWLAYVVVALVTLIPSLIDIIWRGQAGLTMTIYLVRLPIHLLACWSYQKTDNFFTPVFALGMFNLVAGAAMFFVLV